MDNWLECEVSVGMFSTEFAITAQQFDGKTFSLFALQDDVRTKSAPNGSPVSGLLHVNRIKTSNDLAMVVLPQLSPEAGTTVTVKVSQLHQVSA
ncbi:MAG: hypothetical protein IT366_04960 [Candidatus Hydrogenedentes bacterium]|nr:hypothetical protein [Candidatus Hydrogenedentota bacterium]